MKNLLMAMLATLIAGGLSACQPAEKSASAPEPTEMPTGDAPAAPTPVPDFEPLEEVPVAAPPETPAEEAPAAEDAAAEPEWISFFNGENLDGWTVRGAATWEVIDGVLTGESPGGQGHIYAAPELTDLEVKGMFRITDTGGGANSGLYFRANPPEDNPDGYPRGYEAQICHNQDAFTGWLWKPGAPTGEAEKMITEDGEWFPMRVKMVGSLIQIWVKDELVMTHEDDDYTQGYFAIQCHNEGMIVEAKDLYYRDLSTR